MRLFQPPLGTPSVALKWLLLIPCAYVVLRLTIAIAVPALLLDAEWVQSVKLKCLERGDLCLSVKTQNAIVSGMWWGKAFYFEAKPGRSKELKEYVVQGMPKGKAERILTPWNYVGAQFTEK